MWIVNISKLTKNQEMKNFKKEKITPYSFYMLFTVALCPVTPGFARGPHI